MSFPRISVFAAIMRKDFLLVWPMIIAAQISPIWSLCMTTQWFERLPPTLQYLPIGLGAMLAGLLALTTFQQDTPASLTHDWLTRPVGPATMIVAKVIFLVLALFVPTLAGHMVEHVIKHHSPVEVVMSSLASTMIPVGWVMALGLLGLVTVSVKQASSWGYGIAVGAIALGIARVFLPFSEGAGWLTTPLFLLGGGLLSWAVMWLVFRRRRPLAARLVYVVGSAALFLTLAIFPAGARLAVERAMSVEPAAADSVQVSLSGVCLVQVTPVAPGYVRPELLIATTKIVSRPADSTVVVDRTRARYVERDGRDGKGIMGGGQQGAWQSQWLVERAVYEQMVRDGAALRLDYDLALLQPSAAPTEIPIGRGRRYIPQLGYCSARNKLGRNVVECFKPFAHSAAIRVEVVGRPEALCPACMVADYTPGLFQGPGARRNVAIEVPGQPRLDLTGGKVRLTPLKAQAHFRRSASAPLAPFDQIPACGAPPRGAPAAEAPAR